MKIIFLDIDGVLNSVLFEAEQKAGDDSRIDSTRVKLLSEIVERTGASIVLSSTWREDWDSDPMICGNDGKYINECLCECGLSIIDKTPYLSYSDERRLEISTWIARHRSEVESFVILDDILAGWGELWDRVVVTNPYGRGLERRHVEEAVYILNEAGNDF